MNEYAAVYWVYGRKYVEFGDTLGEVISAVQYKADEGKCAFHDDEVYQWLQGEWKQIPESTVGEVVEALNSLESEMSKQSREEAKTTPYQVWLIGPQGTKDFWSHHATEEEAQAERKKFSFKTELNVVR